MPGLPPLPSDVGFIGVTKSIDFFHSALQANEAGQEEDVPVFQFTRIGTFTPLRGREKYLAEQVQSNVTHKVLVTYDNQTKTITADWHLIIDNVRLEIEKAVNMNGLGFFIVIDVIQRGGPVI